MDYQFSIPENISLVVNDYIPPYDFVNDRGSMLRINGSGFISSNSSNGQISPSGISMMAFNGEFELDISMKDTAGEPFEFIGVSFTKEVHLHVSGQPTINFVNCVFDEGVRIKIIGEAESINFYACNFEKDSAIDLETLDFEYYPELIDCISDESSALLIPDDVNEEVSWKLPAILLAAVGVAAAVSAAPKKKLVEHKEKVHVET